MHNKDDTGANSKRWEDSADTKTVAHMPSAVFYLLAKLLLYFQAS